MKAIRYRACLPINVRLPSTRVCETTIPKMKNTKIIAILVLALLLGAVVLQNRQPVETQFLMVTVTMPQILLLLLTTGGGFCLGLLTTLSVRAKTKHKT